MGKILKIEEKVPQPAVLADGTYQGIWGGNVVEIRHDGRLFELTTDEGVRGIGIRVVVHIVNGEATFSTFAN